MAIPRTTEDRDTSDRLLAGLSPATRLIASSLAGDRRALERLAAFPKMAPDVERHRMAPQLLELARNAGTKGSCIDGWTRIHRAAETDQTRVAGDLRSMAATLRGANVTWLPTAELDLLSPFVDVPVVRQGNHLRILVMREHFAAASTALVQNGWTARPLGPGAETVLREEGASWTATSTAGTTLHLSFRGPWWAPSQWDRGVIDRAEPDAGGNPGALRASHADAYILATLAFWLAEPPRALLHLWDLHQIVRDQDRKLAEAINQNTRQDGLQLLVGTAASMAVGLWEHPCHNFVALLLHDQPRWEFFGRKMINIRGAEKVGLSALTLVRLATERRTRLGWSRFLRPLWAHRGEVADETPGNLPWLVRRPMHIFRRLILRKGSTLPPGGWS